MDRTFGSVAPALGPFQHRGRIVAAFSFRVEKTIELAHRRQPPRQRGGLEAALGEAAQKAAQVVGVGVGDAAAGGAQMRGQIGEIVAIGGERVLAGAALGRQHVEEQLDQRFVGCLSAGGPSPLSGSRVSGCLTNLSDGTVTTISRGWYLTKLASENTAT